MWLNNLRWVCAALTGYIQLTSSANIRCYKGSLTNYDEAPLEIAESLLLSLCYNKILNNTFYTPGFRGKVDGPATTAVLSTLIELNETNIFLLDWQKEASSIEFLGNIGRIFSYVASAIPNTIFVGNRFGEALGRMSNKGLDLSRTHLVAHSLGAHLAGYAGKNLVNQGKIVDRITGLDPARPLFEKPSIVSPLGRDDAASVVNILTDPGGYGINSSYATVNIYVNYRYFITGDEEEQVQPGCPIGDFDLFTPNDICSHDRVWMLITEGWRKLSNALIARKAFNYNQLAAEQGNFSESDLVVIGNYIDKSVNGNFYINTNAQSPYGKGLDGLEP